MPESAQLLSLASLIMRPPDHGVARSGRSKLDYSQLIFAATAVRDRLQQADGSVWGLHLSSPFLQLAALIAMQSLDRRAVLLPHRQPAFLEQISREFDGLLLDDHGTRRDTVSLPTLDQLIAEGSERGALTYDWRQPIGFLTSGSTGKPSRVFKSPAQIDNEVQMREQAFRSALGRNRVIHGTASHQHFYGFTFRLIWPLLSGRPFANRQLQIPSDVSAAINTHAKIVLISSPAFLSRARELLDFDELARASTLVFSSGGPLDETTALQFNANARIRLVEIYGSTETGALAWRETLERDPPTPWEPLPGVATAVVDGRLRARASHLADQGWVQTGDKAEPVPTGGFSLRGRADRIVKVGDKRISLDELERHLTVHEDIIDARVVALGGATLGVVAVPTTSGWSQIRMRGKTDTVRRLRDHLARHVDRVSVPKKWLFFKRLPVNEQSKVPVDRLRSAFASQTADQPVWEELGKSEQHWVGQATVPADLPEFEGHFPDNPIVPGVVQIAWVVRAAKRAFGLAGVSGCLEAIKFRTLMKPGDLVQLELRSDPTSWKVRFEMRFGDTVYSSGRVLIETP
jgi:acyl-CoA synthetase (AMP-forming)/AMP-acid ligase II